MEDMDVWKLEGMLHCDVVDCSCAVFHCLSALLSYKCMSVARRDYQNLFGLMDLFGTDCLWP